jgi:hypothetical protein
MYADYARENGIFHEIGVTLPEVHGRALRLHCWRGPGNDFTEMHRFVLTLLRPHLLNAYRQAVTPTQAARSLTPRQLAARAGRARVDQPADRPTPARLRGDRAIPPEQRL